MFNLIHPVERGERGSRRFLSMHRSLLQTVTSEILWHLLSLLLWMKTKG